MHRELTKDEVPKFVLAGNATITLQSGKTGKHYTYQVKRYRDQELYFIRLLKGPNNNEDYKYIGTYRLQFNKFIPAKPHNSMPGDTLPSAIRAIEYLFDKLYDKPDNLLVFHEGRCARCGRKLTTPESIKSGYGPECQAYVEERK